MRSHMKQKGMRFLFWGVILYTALSTTVVWLLQFQLIPSPSSSNPVQAEQQEQKPAINVSETAFAEQFTREYLFWTRGNEEARAERLKSFWKPKMDVQGGLSFDDAAWNSYTRNVDVWEVKERADGSSIKDLIVFAETVLTNVNNEQQQKRVDRYLAVAIRPAGETYIVVETPHFVPAPIATVTESVVTEEEVKKAVPDQIRLEVEKFVTSYWKVYTTGSPEEIGYFHKDNTPVEGLTGVVRFEKLENLKVYQNEEDIYDVEFDVRLTDLASEAELITHYTVHLIQEGDRWYLTQIREGEVDSK
ncbi:conjugal transfer protein [Hazenella sp. IB182357]|uniref:Conjugal transfer protein n=1 Tax=Polycladospora coralii TaxID=2771432 RepID=A0A926NCD7_9BACL|nr:conjugal transfer protein [Polycladospora coralii]MBD1370833.1 conjugal transfer protein [Polycladospora coralii]MBS7529772.1 conjugal transfer protein [Polycladospora coralii]